MNNTHYYDDLNTLLDSLTGGEHVKATWTIGECAITAEGPLSVNGRHCKCGLDIRLDIGVDLDLTSFEVVREDVEVTATRDDEAALNALLDSLADDQEVTAEWRDESGSMIATGSVASDRGDQWVRGPALFLIRFGNGEPHEALHSVTVRRTVTQRWKRDGDSSSHARTN